MTTIEGSTSFVTCLVRRSCRDMLAECMILLVKRVVMTMLKV